MHGRIASFLLAGALLVLPEMALAQLPLPPLLPPPPPPPAASKDTSGERPSERDDDTSSSSSSPPWAEPGAPLPEVPATSEGRDEVIDQIGPAITGRSVAFVTDAMDRVSDMAGSEAPTGGFRVTVLDSGVPNALALPEGNIFVTRQMLALMNGEDELIGVLAHEAGHVTKRHGILAGIGSQVQKVSSVLLGSILPGGALAGQVMTLPVLRQFNRTQEYQADAYAVRLMEDNRFDPEALADVMTTLQMNEDVSRKASGGRAPNFIEGILNTHPPAERRASQVRALKNKKAKGSRSYRPDYLNLINGMRFGDDPRHGVIDGRFFREPVIGLEVAGPDGARMRSGKSAVLIEQDDMRYIVLRMDAKEGQSLKAVFEEQWREELGQNAVPPEPLYLLRDNRRLAWGSASKKDADGRMIQFRLGVIEWNSDYNVKIMAVGEKGEAFDAFAEEIQDTLKSLSPEESARIKGRMITLRQVQKGDTAASLSRLMAYASDQEDWFRLINRLPEDDEVKAGEIVKIVSWAP